MAAWTAVGHLVVDVAQGLLDLLGRNSRPLEPHRARRQQGLDLDDVAGLDP